MRRIWLGSAIVAVAALVLRAGWSVLRARTEKQYEAALQEGKTAAAAGAMGKARLALMGAAALRPEPGEAQYLLGAVEKAMGRPDAARGAWLSVPPGSPFARHAAMMLARGASIRPAKWPRPPASATARPSWTGSSSATGIGSFSPTRRPLPRGWPATPSP